MKQCPNCNGPLDDKGTCIVCGTTTQLNLSEEDGMVIHKSFKEILEQYSIPLTPEEQQRTIDALASVPEVYPIAYDEFVKAADKVLGVSHLRKKKEETSQ